MHVISPVIWSLFGAFLASAVHYPFFGYGGLFLFAAAWIFASGLIAERLLR